MRRSRAVLAAPPLPRDAQRQIATGALLTHLADQIADLRHGSSPSEVIGRVLALLRADLGLSPQELEERLLALVHADELGDEHDSARRAVLVIARSLPEKVEVTGWVPGEVVKRGGDKVTVTAEPCPECEVSPVVLINSALRCLDVSCTWHGEPPF